MPGPGCDGDINQLAGEIVIVRLGDAHGAKFAGSQRLSPGSEM